MARRTLGRTEIALAIVFAVAIIVAGGVALLILINQPQPIYTDAAAIPSAASAPAAPQSAVVANAQRRVRELLTQDTSLHGLSIAVGKDGELVWAEGFGYADAKHRATVTPRTRFRTGSVSKTMTAAAVALLYDRGRIDLDIPVQTYAPAYPQKQWTVTTRQLLGDVAGVHRLRGENNNNDQVPRGFCKTVDEALRTFAYEPLAFEPGTNYRYSTSGWILLSAVVEGASAQPFAAFMSHDVFTPLGMDRTALEGADKDQDVADFTDSHRKDAPSVVEDYACTVGAGAFLSTPSDLVRLGSAMLKPGLLKAETITLFQTPLTLKSGVSTGFALGWKVDTIPLAGAQVRTLRHRASLIAGAVSLYVFPDRDLVLAVMANVPNTVGVEAIALQIAETFAR